MKKKKRVKRVVVKGWAVLSKGLFADFTVSNVWAYGRANSFKDNRIVKAELRYEVPEGKRK